MLSFIALLSQLFASQLQDLVFYTETYPWVRNYLHTYFHLLLKVG